MRTLLCSMLCLQFVCLSAYTAPTGLNIIPTADVLDYNVMSAEFESVGDGELWGDSRNQFGLLQFGMGGGVEAGIDHSL